MIKNLVKSNRSYRKFINSQKVSEQQLIELVDLARVTPSSKNLQPLRYLLVTDEKDSNFVFKQLKWAWYLKNWSGPYEDEQPPSYIVVCIDTDINDKADIDSGIAAQTILLGAVESGLGGCIIRTVNGYAIKKHFNLPESIEVVMVLAIGYPDQKIILEEIDNDDSVEYYENDEGTHFVPKRKLNDILL